MSDTFKRPRLDDPEEYAIIKAIHFKEPERYYDKLDPQEEVDRWESRLRNNNKSAR